MTVGKKSVLFLADPWSALDHAEDSSLHLARVGAKNFGLTSYWAHPDKVYYLDGTFYVKIEGRLLTSDPTVTLQPQPGAVKLSQFHSVHWRKDPPVDLNTFRTWSLLASAADKTKFYNSPKALLSWNEKFCSLRFKGTIADTCVTDSIDIALEFARAHSTDEVLVKPSGEAASRGVCFLPKEPTAARLTIEETRKKSGPWLVLQRYNSAILKHGETRAFIIGGKVAGAMLKRPKPGSPIMNFDTPGGSHAPTLELAVLSKAQKKTALEIGSAMKKEGVHLATIDFIQNEVLEINVTSPGLLDWHDSQKQAKTNLAQRYWQLILKK